MPSEQFERIQKIRNEFHQASVRVRDSLNNAIKHLADGLYSRNPHFIFELIQNAEDNTYDNPSPSLSFCLAKIDPTGTDAADGALIIKNNETGFTSENVNAICQIGKTTKQKAQGYIGEKGIGFKSVFLVTTNPHIFSKGYRFCLPERDEETGFGYIVPQWIKLPEGLDPTQTHIILPLTKPDFGYDRIEEMLLEIEPETVLFLSKLQEIRIKTDSGTDLSVLKNDSAMPKVEILVEGRKQGRSFSKVDEFLVCTETVNKPEDIHHEKREGIENREISVAFPLDEYSASAGKIFAYLPVRSDTGFPFLINADFILPSSREDIQDVPWNHWLMDCVADLVASIFLPALKDKELLTAGFLEKLASRLNDLGEAINGASYGVDRDSLFHPIFKRVREALMNEELLPANDGTFVSALNAKLARGDAIRDLLEHKQLGDLFDSSNEIKWLSDEITQDRTPELRSFLMKLDVEEVRPPTFASRLSEEFLEQQDDTWFIEFYRFLSTHYRDLRYYLPTKPILRLEDGTHVNPPRGDGSSPSAYLASEADADTPSPIIKVELTQDEEVRNFLRELGVREREIVDDVIEHILPKYECGNRIILVEEHRIDFEKIKRACKTDSQANKTRLQKRLRQTPFVLVENTHVERPIYRKPNQLYFGSDELRLYFAGNDSRAFVNLDEYPDSARELLQDLCVTCIIRVEKRPRDFHGHIILYREWGRHARGLDGFDPDIQVDGLERALIDPNGPKSEFIWNYIAKPNSNCIRGIVENSTNQDYRGSSTEEHISEDFGRLLIETAWLPDSAGNMRRPCELTLNDLPESFERDPNLAEQLGMGRDEVTEFAVEHGLPAEILNDLIQNPQECEEFFVAWRAARNASPPSGEGTEVEPNPPISGRDTQRTRSRPGFPVKEVSNPNRWRAKFDEELENLPAREYEQRVRSVLVNAATAYTRVWLKVMYTNDDDRMICQMCEEEMPFKKRDGEYYFEAVEALTNEHFTTVHEAQFLALCPECAAKYKEFVKRNQETVNDVKNQLLHADNCQVSLRLGENEANLRFVEQHWSEVRAILESA